MIRNGKEIETESCHALVTSTMTKPPPQTKPLLKNMVFCTNSALAIRCSLSVMRCAKFDAYGRRPKFHNSLLSTNLLGRKRLHGKRENNSIVHLKNPSSAIIAKLSLLPLTSISRWRVKSRTKIMSLELLLLTASSAPVPFAFRY